MMGLYEQLHSVAGSEESDEIQARSEVMIPMSLGNLDKEG
jgi:hypothetical protein